MLRHATDQITCVQAIGIARRNELSQVGYLRNTLTLVLCLLTLTAIIFAVIAFVRPEDLPLCFVTQSTIHCPLSDRSIPSGMSATEAIRGERFSYSGWDTLIVEILGVMAAALSAGVALRGFRRRRSPYDFPMLLALIKLPTGALTAVFGLLLIRAQVVPGLTVLQSSAQIVAWAVILGYSQQLFTRYIDQRAQTVLDTVGATSETSARGRDTS